MRADDTGDTADSGLVDLHIHGAFGVDVLTAGPLELDRLSRGLLERGVTSFLPTLVPVPLRELGEVVARLSSWIASRRPLDGRGALPLGLHFEGPFVSTSRCGALHRESFLDGANPALVEAFFEALGTLPGRPMITLAPEIPGGLTLISELVKRGFVVSIGHTDAASSTLDEAARRGARHMTHFANAMRPLHHREVGPVGWGLLNDDVTVDVIADMAHLSAEMLHLIFKAKGHGRVAVISDAVPPAGLAEGDHRVWGETLTVRGGTARNAAGNLAGSVQLLDDATRNLMSLGFSEEAVHEAASRVPRRVLSR